MDFKKKLRIRLITAFSICAVGIAFIVLSLFLQTEKVYLSSLGLCMTLIGAVRIRNYFIITRSEDSIRKQQITETDERNISIAQKARTVAFYVYFIASGISVITFQFLGRQEIAEIISYSVCFVLVVYWIAWMIIRKRS